ncbi:MAG: hypothetical protein ACRD6W_17615, partial [Nitrososphaerales archaeon]
MKDVHYFQTNLDYKRYQVTTVNLYSMKNVRTAPNYSNYRGRFTFEVDEDGFEGVTIQISTTGKLNIYAPRGGPFAETILPRTLEILGEANGSPVNIVEENVGFTPSSDSLRLHERITAIYGREKIVQMLPAIVRRSKTGEVIFGQCRDCTGYPRELAMELGVAARRGVRIQALIANRPESGEFMSNVMKAKEKFPDLVEYRFHPGDVYSSLFGIRGREVVEYYHLSDGPNMGIHFNDPIIT